MLKSFLSNYKYFFLFSNGFIFDFFIKKLLELFVKHVLIYLSLFFAEKYVIEFITKKNIEILIIYLNKSHDFFNFSFSYFFFFTIFFLLISLILFNLMFLIL